MSLADTLKKKSRIKWTELRGEKIGVKMLTRNEMLDHAAQVQQTEGDRDLFALFATYLVDADGKQALTVDEMEEVLTNPELQFIIEEFNKANGLADEEAEKN